MSKARITPIKDTNRKGEREISIPKPELMAAYLGTLIATIILTAFEKNGIKLKIGRPPQIESRKSESSINLTLRHGNMCPLKKIQRTFCREEHHYPT